MQRAFKYVLFLYFQCDNLHYIFMSTENNRKYFRCYTWKCMQYVACVKCQLIMQFNHFWMTKTIAATLLPFMVNSTIAYSTCNYWVGFSCSSFILMSNSVLVYWFTSIRVMTFIDWTVIKRTRFQFDSTWKLYSLQLKCDWTMYLLYKPRNLITQGLILSNFFWLPFWICCNFQVAKV